jgi:hypothetical protein
MDLFDMIVLILIIYYFIIKILMGLNSVPVEREIGRREIIRLPTTPIESADNFISIKDMFGTYFITINEIKSQESCCNLKNGGYSSYIFCYSSPELSCLTRFTPLRGFHKENVLCRIENDKLYVYYSPFPQNDTNEYRCYSVAFNKM